MIASCTKKEEEMLPRKYQSVRIKQPQQKESLRKHNSFGHSLISIILSWVYDHGNG
jgi:hypothetical protein